MSDATVRLGIIGLGTMGSAHARSILDGAVEGLTLAAVCDRDPQRIDAAADGTDIARFEIDERTGGDGDIVQPVREADVAALAAELRGLDLEAVAICFLNSYVNPSNEVRAAESRWRLRDRELCRRDIRGICSLTAKRGRRKKRDRKETYPCWRTWQPPPGEAG